MVARVLVWGALGVYIIYIISIAGIKTFFDVAFLKNVLISLSIYFVTYGVPIAVYLYTRTRLSKVWCRIISWIALLICVTLGTYLEAETTADKTALAVLPFVWVGQLVYASIFLALVASYKNRKPKSL